MIDDKDAIINAFRPIEHFFKIMDMTLIENEENISRMYSELGLALCSIFRNKIEEVFAVKTKGNQDER